MSDSAKWIDIQKPQKKTKAKLDDKIVNGIPYWEWEQNEVNKFISQGDSTDTIKKKIKKKRDYYGKQDVQKEKAKARTKEGFVPKPKPVNVDIQAVIEAKRQSIVNDTTKSDPLFRGEGTFIQSSYDPRLLLCSISYPNFNKRIRGQTYVPENRDEPRTDESYESGIGRGDGYYLHSRGVRPNRVSKFTDEESLNPYMNPNIDMSGGGVNRIYPLPPPKRDDPNTWGYDEKDVFDGNYGYGLVVMKREYTSDYSKGFSQATREGVMADANKSSAGNLLYNTGLPTISPNRYLTTKFKIAFNTGSDAIMPNLGTNKLTDEQFKELGRKYERRKDQFYALIPTLKKIENVTWLGLDTLKTQVSSKTAPPNGVLYDDLWFSENKRYEEEKSADPDWVWTIGSKGGNLAGHDTSASQSVGGTGLLFLGENQTEGIRQLPPIMVHIDTTYGCVFIKYVDRMEYLGQLKYTMSYGKPVWNMDSVLTQSNFKLDDKHLDRDVFHNQILMLRGHRYVEINGHQYGVSSGINMRIDHLNYRTQLGDAKYHDELVDLHRKYYLRTGKTQEDIVNSILLKYCKSLKPIFISNNPTMDSTALGKSHTHTENSRHRPSLTDVRLQMEEMEWNPNDIQGYSNETESEEDDFDDVVEFDTIRKVTKRFIGDMSESSYGAYTDMEERFLEWEEEWKKKDPTRTLQLRELGQRFYTDNLERNDDVANLFYVPEDVGERDSAVKILGRGRPSHLGLDFQYQYEPEGNLSIGEIQRRKPEGRYFKKGHPRTKLSERTLDRMEYQQSPASTHTGRYGFDRYEPKPTEEGGNEYLFNQNFDHYLNRDLKFYDMVGRPVSKQDFATTSMKSMTPLITEPRAPNIKFIEEYIDEFPDIEVDFIGDDGEISKTPAEHVFYRTSDGRTDGDTASGLIGSFQDPVGSDKDIVMFQSGIVSNEYPSDWLRGHIVGGYNIYGKPKPKDYTNVQMGYVGSEKFSMMGDAEDKNQRHEMGRSLQVREGVGGIMTIIFTSKEAKEYAHQEQPPMRVILEDVASEVGEKPPYLPPKNPTGKRLRKPDNVSKYRWMDNESVTLPFNDKNSEYQKSGKWDESTRLTGRIRPKFYYNEPSKKNFGIVLKDKKKGKKLKKFSVGDDASNQEVRDYFLKNSRYSGKLLNPIEDKGPAFELQLDETDIAKIENDMDKMGVSQKEINKMTKVMNGVITGKWRFIVRDYTEEEIAEQNKTEEEPIEEPIEESSEDEMGKLDDIDSDD